MTLLIVTLENCWIYIRGRTVSECCSVRVSRVGPSAGQAREPYLDNLLRGPRMGLDPSWLDLAFLRCPNFQSRGPNIVILEVVPTSSQSLTVKEFCFQARGKRGRFFMKFLAATFPGNRRTKIGKVFRQIFTTFFRRCRRKFSPEFRSRFFFQQNKKALGPPDAKSGRPKTPNPTTTDPTRHSRLSDLRNRTWNPSESYSDKEMPLSRRRALRRLLCGLGSQLRIYTTTTERKSFGELP